MQRTGTVYIKLLITTFFWGGTFVAGKWAVGEAPPFFVAFLRFAIASLVLWALVAWRRRGSDDRFPLPEGGARWAGLFSLGLTGVFLYNFVFLKGLSWTSATNGSLIVAFNPLLTAVLSALWLKERVRPVQAGGLLLALLGVGVVITRGSITVIRSLSFNHGDLLMLGAPLAWALYTILGKKVLRYFPPLVATAYAWRGAGLGLRQPRARLRGAALRPDPFGEAERFPAGGRDPCRGRSGHRYIGQTSGSGRGRRLTPSRLAHFKV
ncbi:MAG: Permease of the drug/metabolite transporter superfamily [Deltaproteobacteria bacterium]|nr:Permease of the drug/metabolite transporter superfamily [Deltaproteobacteria bacterium]